MSLLRNRGIDLAANSKRTMVLPETEAQRQQQARFAKADRDRKPALATSHQRGSDQPSFCNGLQNSRIAPPSSA